MRVHYWSHSKFAKWFTNTFGGEKQLDCGTAEEWVAWRKASKQHKVVHWFVQEFLNDVQNFVNWPNDRLNDIRVYIRNRWVDNTSVLKTKLKPGQYYDLDTKILHGLFEELVDFIEIEKAWMQIVWSDEDKAKYKFPRRWKMLRWKAWRCAEAGIDHLNWEMQLKYDDEYIDKDDPNYGKPTYQALAAQKQFALYHWWKYVRPNRLDPYDISGWSANCAMRREGKDDNDIMSWMVDDKTEEQRLETRRVLDLSQKIEQQYFDEDTRMMVALIEIRQSLWT